MKKLVRRFCDCVFRVWEATVCWSFLWLILVFGFFLLLIVISVWPHRAEGWQEIAFKCLVSGGDAGARILSGVGYILVWLVGGGILVSFVISRWQWLEHGGFRRGRFLLKDHIVVLGWDDGLFSVVQQATNPKGGQAADCYVLTNQDAFGLQTRLRRAGLKDVCVYEGEYDGRTEWESLNLSDARRIFVAGEGDEEVHDARVLMACKTLEGKVPNSNRVVNIRDFGLAKRLKSRLRSSSNVAIENFHLSWGRHLLDGLSLDGSPSRLNLFVVGLGAMGKAVIKAAFEKFEKVTVVVTDDSEKFTEEVARFKCLFPECGLESLPWQTDPDAKALQRLNEFYKQAIHQKDEPLAVVVAKKRSEKGWFFMLDLLRIWEECRGSAECTSKVSFALNQEIGGCAADWQDEDLRIAGNQCVRLFGFKRGAPVLQSTNPWK